MAETNTFARSLHDVGLAAWFGGSLMGAVGLNGSAAQANNPRERSAIATRGWKRWAPVSAAAIAAHLLGGALIIGANRQRIAGQSGVAAWTVTKTALTGAALAATALSGAAGTKLDATPDIHVDGATEPSSQTPADAARAQKMLRPLQWAIPLLTGALVVVSARMGEQQRPAEVAGGLLGRVLPG